MLKHKFILIAQLLLLTSLSHAEISGTSEGRISSSPIDVRVSGKFSLVDAGARDVTAKKGEKAIPIKNSTTFELVLFFPINAAHTFSLFSQLDISQLSGDQKTSEIIPSMLLGVTNQQNCRWCYSVSAGAERASLFKINKIALSTPTDGNYISVPMAKANASMGYFLTTNGLKFGPELSYEITEPRSYSSVNADFIDISAIQRICPQVKFMGSEGMAKNFSVGFRVCNESYTQFQNNNEIDVNARTYGSELSYLF